MFRKFAEATTLKDLQLYAGNAPCQSVQMQESFAWFEKQV